MGEGLGLLVEVGEGLALLLALGVVFLDFLGVGVSLELVVELFIALEVELGEGVDGEVPVELLSPWLLPLLVWGGVEGSVVGKLLLPEVKFPGRSIACKRSPPRIERIKEGASLLKRFSFTTTTFHDGYFPSELLILSRTRLLCQLVIQAHKVLSLLKRYPALTPLNLGERRDLYLNFPCFR